MNKFQIGNINTRIGDYKIRKMKYLQIFISQKYFIHINPKEGYAKGTQGYEEASLNTFVIVKFT